MIRISILLLMGFLLSMEAYACDQCSVQLGSGITSEGHYVGYRFRFRKQFGSSIVQKSLDGRKHLSHFAERGDIKELYAVHEVYGNYKLRRNWHVSAAMPYVNNYRSVDGLTSADAYGFGDPWLMVRHQSIREGETGRSLMSIGAGAKFALGQTKLSEGDDALDLDMQPGSGSSDWLADVTLVHTWRKWFLLMQNTLKLNGDSPGDYRYGNAYSGALDIGIHLLQDKSTSMMLSTGVSTECLGRDMELGERIGTGSQTYYLDGGLQLRRDRLSARLAYQQNLADQLDTQQIPTTYRMSFGVQLDI